MTYNVFGGTLNLTLYLSNLIYLPPTVALYIISNVHLSNDTFQRLEAGSSYLHIGYISMEYGSSSCIKVISNRSKIPIPQCKTVISHNSGSIKHRATRFACSMGFSVMTALMVMTAIFACDQKWPCISNWTNSWVMSLRLNAILLQFY